MLGYGRHFHYMQGVETPQYVRAWVFEQAGKTAAIVCAEFCFCTDILKLAVVGLLQEMQPEAGWRDENIMILGQHTHSTAGGYGQYAVYNLTTPGFQEDVFEHYRDGLVRSIAEAYERLRSARLSWHTGEFDKDAEVAFNRSIDAFNQNPDVKEKIPYKQRHLAADRTMQLLRVDDATTGKPIGLLNWFGVHTTSVGNHLRKVCYDNKGYAAEFLEQELKEKYGAEGIFTTFAQEACGDISPNFRYSIRKGIYKGKHEDDYESAAYNGRLQADKAREIFEEAPTKGQNISPELGIDYALCYGDMTDVHIDPRFADGLENQYTGGACMGIAFLEGTTDGRGMSKVAGTLLKAIFQPIHRLEILAARMRKDKAASELTIRRLLAQRPKSIALNLSEGSVIGTNRHDKLAIPSFFDPILKYIKMMRTEHGTLLPAPWAPERLPLQIITIGTLAFIGIPSEITTVAARRLRQTLAPTLAQKGIETIIMCPYANSYAGYITTREEYRTQSYEGGHTLYGKWTLAAYQMQFDKLAASMLLPQNERPILGEGAFLLPREDYWVRFADESVQVL